MIDTLPLTTARDLARPLPLLLPQDIHDMRRVACLSMRELARRLGANLSTVSEWESGAKVPTRQHAQQLLTTCSERSVRLMRSAHGRAVCASGP
jgi:DNA-binding transcriptional regulator YiaG